MRKIWGLYREASNISAKNSREMSHIIEIYDMWLRLNSDGYTFSRYLKESGMTNVALCALTDAGVRLYRELKSTGINIVCFIDPGDMVLPDVRCVSSEEICEEGIDMVIVTDPFKFEIFREKLTAKGYKNIDSIDGILYAMLKAQAEKEG
ncbi:MAG: hypothetical protein K6F86_09935 [Lachnospiraceae bacterium]|nr:hypothetical protein [Lachnospiraceae bacterium]